MSEATLMRKRVRQEPGNSTREPGPHYNPLTTGDKKGDLPRSQQHLRKGPSKTKRRGRGLTMTKLGHYSVVLVLCVVGLPAYLWHYPGSPYYTGIQFNDKLALIKQDASEFLETHLNLFYDQAASFMEETADFLMIGDMCPYVDNTVAAIRDYFPQKIKGQQQAFEAIEKAFQYWEMGRSNGGSRAPLILAITGPTGVGKTETAHVLGEALLKKRLKLEGSPHTHPSGLLIFRGEDFADASEMPLSRYHTEIKTRLVNHLRHCNGNAVVLFDEVQKVIPGTLDVLMEAMTEHPTLTFFSNGKSTTVDCSKVIFILVSDIGWERMVAKQLEYKTREEVPAEKLRRIAKAALDDQWKALRFGKVVDEVIPYLPMEQEQMQEVLALKLEYLSDQFHGIYWKRLCVSNPAQEYLVSHRFIKYTTYKTPASEVMGISKHFAEYGARNIENSGPLKALQTQMFRSMQPWKPEKILLVQYDGNTDQVEMTWCLHASSECPSDEDFVKIAWDQMSECQIVWKGTLSEYGST